eukprot:c19223_g2_i1.p1 GENE.c19223_g2_i1~~c19223_g2_i1.p1  ORF type:complete len:250 (-),score=100.12 c19223_g2_i1:126-800(-)
MSEQVQLTKKQITELKEAFSCFDRDGDGSISVKELGDVIRSLGTDPSESELQDLVNEVDVDGDGHIDFSEFLTMMAKKMAEVDEEAELREAFNLFDTSGQGTIPVSQLCSAVRSLGAETDEAECLSMARECGATTTIDLRNFTTIVSKKLQDHTSEEEIYQAFQVFDEEGKGFITLAALRNILTMLGAERMTQDEFEAMCSKAKLTGDSTQVNYRQFIKIMRSL